MCCAIASLATYAWIDNSLLNPKTEFCNNPVWLIIRLMAITLSFLNFFVAIILTKQVKTILESKDKPYNRDLFSPLFFLIFSNLGIELCGSIWDIFF